MWNLRCEAHYGLKQFREVIAIGNEAAEQLAGSRETTVMYRSAAIALTKAAAHCEFGEFGIARSECRELVERFGRRWSPGFDARTAAALLVQAQAERGLGEEERAVGLLEEVLGRFGTAGIRMCSIRSFGLCS